ncbi:MAG TPA: sugar ABC transporter substrate-binding protein [Chloroflexota bacterium]|nr:sugar ABC transporter substrate-binding protein [Chloroflexota bacterium]
MLLGAVIAACAAPAPTATPAPAKPAEKPPEKPAEKPTAAAQPAAAPTNTPAAAAKPAEPTKPAAEPTKPAGAPAAQPAGSKAPVELRIHDWEQDPENVFYGPLFKKFEEEHPNIKIKKEWFPRDDMHTKELALAATGQIGDTVRINVAVLTKELVNKGVIQSLTPFINKDTKWNQNDQKQFWPGNIANYMYKGDQWGYPVVGHPGCIQHYTNLSMADKVGKPAPADTGQWTQDQIIEIYKAMTQSSGGRTTVYGVLPCLGGEGAVGVLRAFGGDYYNEEGTKAMVGTPESIKGIEWLSDLWNKHKVAIPPEAKADASQVFPGGQVGIVVLTSFAAGGLYPKLVGDKFNWNVLPPPIGPSGKRESQVSSDGYGMSKATKNPDEAWEVVKLYASQEHGYNRFKNGLGSPGSRYDIWGSDAFRKDFPKLTMVWNTLVDPAKNPPLRPWNHPQNGRYFETDTAINNILQDVWLGKKPAAQAAAEAQKTAQEIMDKPPV